MGVSDALALNTEQREPVGPDATGATSRHGLDHRHHRRAFETRMTMAGFTVRLGGRLDSRGMYHSVAIVMLSGCMPIAPCTHGLCTDEGKRAQKHHAQQNYRTGFEALFIQWIPFAS